MSTTIVPAFSRSEARRKALQEELNELLDLVGPVPMVDLLIERAFQLRATDIHLDPTATGLRVRMRVDGMLHDVLNVPLAQMPPVVSRIKLLADMDISERRSTQDGHISTKNGEVSRDVRVASGPCVYGERLVLRLMADGSALHNLEELGFEPEQLEIIRSMVASPHGVLLSAGPVGSGKSTLMYTCFEMLNEQFRSLISIEDPVERRITGTTQIQIEPKMNFHFVDALRGVLRQDPNVIMVGEIRDPETAQITVRAGRTGVFVLTTLHANDASAVIDVFRDFGVPPMFIADSVVAIVAQRLLRKVCTACQESYPAEVTTLATLGLDLNQAEPVMLKRGRGCDECFHTGYRGRTGIFEIFVLDEEIRLAILEGKPRAHLMQLAESRGMRTMQQVAIKKILDGQTTPEEMNRVLLSY
jgi:type II secretory ATPase GspE/PulE/Tfp pilus assembly ATPase PilB-like protein